MIAFVALYLRPDYGLEFYAQQGQIAKLAAAAQLPARIEALVAGMKVNSEGQTLQNRALAAATVISTVFWGFGDVFACHLQQWLSSPHR